VRAVRVDEFKEVVRRRAADERRHDDDRHLQRLDLGSRQRVRLRAVNANLVKMLLPLAGPTLNTTRLIIIDTEHAIGRFLSRSFV